MLSELIVKHYDKLNKNDFANCNNKLDTPW